MTRTVSRAVSRAVLASSLGALSLAAASDTDTDTDTDMGQRIATAGNGRGATACIACHGPDGAGNAAAGFPRLSGLDAGYLAKQLDDYRSGTRVNPIMQPIAEALDDEEGVAVSAYFGTLAGSPAPAPSGRADRSPRSLGERLATRGAWERDVPECVSCHGPGGSGVGAAFPRLAGQHASYLAAQLQAWKLGTRDNDPDGLMRTVAERLSDAESAAVAAFLNAHERPQDPRFEGDTAATRERFHDHAGFYGREVDGRVLGGEGDATR